MQHAAVKMYIMLYSVLFIAKALAAPISGLDLKYYNQYYYYSLSAVCHLSIYSELNSWAPYAVLHRLNKLTQVN